MSDFSIVGKGALHDVIIDILGIEKYKGYYDDKESSDKLYLGKLNEIQSKDHLFLAIASIRNMLLREFLLKQLKAKNTLNFNAISQKANLSRNVSCGTGNIILPFVQIGVNTLIGDGNIVFSNSVIEHDCKLGNNINIAPGVSISGNVIIEDNVYIGVGANIGDGITIKKNSVIGAGSTVLKDVESYSVYFGTPAKKIKQNNLYKSVNT